MLCGMECAEFLKILGSRIKAFRKTQGISQEMLAEASGLSVVFVSNVENGHRRASICTYQEMATALGMSLSELVELPEDGASWDESLLDVFQLAKSLDGNKQKLFVDAARGMLKGLEGQ